MTKPLVSVIISTYNRKNLLSRAIDSVLLQDYKNIEIIISDDCSNIDLGELVASKRKKTKYQIKYRKNNINSGACYTRNAGISIAEGFFVTGLDDDDEFTSDRISYLVKNYDKKYSFITSNTKVITKNKEFELFSKKFNKIISYESSLWENVIGTQILAERSKFIGCGGFDLNLKSSQDIDMWIRLIKKYGSALRLKKSTYILHTEHEKDRISKSSNKSKELESFQKKHSINMTLSQKKYSYFKLMLWKNNHKLSFSILKTLNFKSFLFIIKKKLKII